MTPKGSKGQLVDPLRYGTAEQAGNPGRRICLRQDPLQAAGRGQEPPHHRAGHGGRREAVDSEANFAAAVAAFGQILRGGEFTGTFSYDDVIALATANRGAGHLRLPSRVHQPRAARQDRRGPCSNGLNQKASAAARTGRRPLPAVTMGDGRNGRDPLPEGSASATSMRATCRRATASAMACWSSISSPSPSSSPRPSCNGRRPKYVDAVIGVVLLADFAARLWIIRRPLRMVFSVYGLIDIVVIVSMLAPIVGEGLAFLRVARVLRLLRSYTMVKRLRQDFPWFRKNEQIVMSALNLGVFIFIMTALVYETQHFTNPEDRQLCRRALFHGHGAHHHGLRRRGAGGHHRADDRRGHHDLRRVAVPAPRPGHAPAGQGVLQAARIAASRGMTATPSTARPAAACSTSRTRAPSEPRKQLLAIVLQP